MATSQEHDGLGLGTLLFATACGIGLGLLTAPEAGQRTRRQLRKRLATLGGGVADRLGTVQERIGDVGARAGQRVKNRFASMQEDDRWEAAQARLNDLEERLERLAADQEDEEEERGGFMTAAVGLAAGAGLAYLMSAEAAEPARTKVQEVAGDLRREATNRWEQFRRGGTKADTSSEKFSPE